jgi:hypothetical protein
MKFPQWATPRRRAILAELLVHSRGLCVHGHNPCPKLLEHCYEVASEELIADWKADDRVERELAWQREKRRLHALPQIRKRGPFDSIRREQFMAQRPLYRIVGIGVSAFTQHRVAQVEIPGLKATLWVDLSGIKAEGVSKNKLRKLARYKRGSVPKSMVPQIEARVRQQVARVL